MAIKLARTALALAFAGAMVCCDSAMAKVKDLSENFIFEVDRQQVEDEVNFIQDQFFKKFGIQVTVKPKLIQVDNEAEPFGEYSFHEITLGRLSKEQFSRLDEYYRFPLASGEIPKRKFSPKHSYQLIDFLLPKIQPLPGKVLFHGLRKELLSEASGQGDHVFFAANCMSTVIDVLNSDRRPYSFFGYASGENDSQPVYQALASAGTSVSVKYDPQRASAYDYFILPDGDGAEKGVFHTGVFIGPGLIFEKVGLGWDRYRVGAYVPTAKSEHRRLKAPLSFPEELSLNREVQEDDVYWKNPLTVVYDPSLERYVLDPKNPVSRAVRSPLVRICTLEDAEKKLCDNWPHEGGPASVD